MRSSTQRPIHILLAEDSDSDVFLTTEALREGKVLNQLHVVYDGVEAMQFLRRDPPFGATVETRVVAAVDGWKTRPVGPAFDAARRALRAGYGREPVFIGCGATIPFVGPFARVLGGVPALLLGLEDPPCNAHGENESLDLADFAKAARGSAHLLSELSRP